MKRVKAFTASMIVFAGLCAAGSAVADGYQQLSPVAAYTAESATYIVFAQNVGVNGCSLSKNSIIITTAESAHTPEFIKAALSVALTAIATETPIKVYWSGCFSSGRPKAILIGLGTVEIN